MSSRAAISTCLTAIVLSASCGGTRVAPSATSASALASSTPIASASASNLSLATHDGPLDPETLMAEVRWLASPDLRGRGSASPDEARARAHLAKALDSAGIERIGSGKARTQSFDAANPTEPLAANAHALKPSANVFGVIRATSPRFKDEVIVLGAHYDHLGELNGKIYFGADDNASGVAAVLGIARELMKRREELGRDVVVVFFGAEEIGMRGSAAFAQKGPIASRLMAAMVNVDMIGRPLSDQPLLRAAQRFVGIDPEASVGVDGLRDRPSFTRVVRDACRVEKHVAVTIDDLPEALRSTVEDLSRGRGDNYSFEAVAVPAIFFSSAESTDYHQPTDTPETLSPELIAIRARVIERVVIGLSNSPREGGAPSL